MASRRLPTAARPQRGAGVILILFLVTVAVLAYLVTELSAVSERTRRIEVEGSDLLAAKEAVLAFNFGRGADARDPDKMSLGRLPLPDMGRRGITDPDLTNDHEGESAGVGLAGNAADTLLLGRLPWKTLGSRPLRDDSGECLWYGLSAAWKNTNNQPSADPLRYLPPTYNWDSLGDFDLYDAQLQRISANPHQNRAVAVILAPGPPLPGQSRTPSATAGEFVSRCGGNYDALNYLDPAALATAAASTGTRFNAFTTQVASTHADYSTDPAGRNAMSGSPPVVPKNVLAQPVGTQAAGAPVAATNDRVVAITNDEIFARLLTQTHALGVPAKINELLTQLQACLQTPNPAGELPSTGLATLGSKRVGKLDPAIGCAAATELARWRDNLWYAMTPKGSGVRLNTTCDGLLVFSGTRTPAQRRSNGGEKAAASNYLETALGLFTNAGDLAAAMPNAFGLAGNPPTTDVGICLTHPAPTSFSVDVGNMTDRLAVNPSNQVLLQRDAVAQTITLGNPASVSGSFGNVSAVACTWYTNPVLFGTGIRVYFRFRYNFFDPATTSVGPGFTFALADADTNAASVCGGSKPNGSTNRGQLMGYAGVMVDSANTPISTITPPKMAFEFDTSQNADRADTTGSHIAAVYWGVLDKDGDAQLDESPPDGILDQDDADDDNQHAMPAALQSVVAPITQPDPVNDSAFGYPCLRDPVDANCNNVPVTGRIYHVRIDITRTYDVANQRAAYYHRLWIRQDTPHPDMDNLNDDFRNLQPGIAPDLQNRDQNGDSVRDDVYIYDSVYANLPVPLTGEAFRRLRFGFTIAQPTRREEVVISNLAVKTR